MRVPAGMTNAGSTAHIEVDALQVGMFIHLDMGWMSHPFPLSSFRIASPQQIAIIRSLGVKKLRWSPEHSAPTEAEQAAQVTAETATPALTADETPEQRRQRESRAKAAREREALAVCERQFTEAAHETK